MLVRLLYLLLKIKGPVERKIMQDPNLLLQRDSLVLPLSRWPFFVLIAANP